MRYSRRPAAERSAAPVADHPRCGSSATTGATLRIDCSKVENELGWRSEESFETGIAKTVRWYLDNEAVELPK